MPQAPPRVLLLTLLFPPDGVSTAILLGELVRRLRAMGHDLVVVTTTPHYNRDDDALAAQPLRRRWLGLLYESRLGDVPVYHVRVRPKGSRVLARLFDYLLFHLVGTAAALIYGGRYRVVLAPSPPLTVGLCAALLARLRGAAFVYNVQEIYPDIAVQLGVLRNRVLIGVAAWVERRIYGWARCVTTISEAFARRIQAKGVPASRLHVIPNFVDTAGLRPLPKDNPFARAHGLQQRFVALYAGNLGLTQDLEGLLDAAARLRHLPELLVLLVGDGAKRRWLEERVTAEGLVNVRLLPYQPSSAVLHLYASADLCLVPMRAGTVRDTFPSKVYTIMAAGRPALVAAEDDSDLATVVRRADCGWVLPPEEPAALAAALEQAYRRRAELPEIGARGRAYVEAHHSADAVARQYARLLAELA